MSTLRKVSTQIRNDYKLKGSAQSIHWTQRKPTPFHNKEEIWTIYRYIFTLVFFLNFFCLLFLNFLFYIFFSFVFDLVLLPISFFHSVIISICIAFLFPHSFLSQDFFYSLLFFILSLPLSLSPPFPVPPKCLYLLSSTVTTHWTAYYDNFTHCPHPSEILDNSIFPYNDWTTPLHPLEIYYSVVTTYNTSSPLHPLSPPHLLFYHHHFNYLNISLYANNSYLPNTLFIDNIAKDFTYYANILFGIDSINLLLLSYTSRSVNRNNTKTWLKTKLAWA
jgi:hypothetical protein